MRTERQRFYLLDWLRLGTLLAIQILHSNEFVFYEDVNPIIDQSVIFRPVIDYWARLFTIGGQILVALIYLVFGYSEKSRASLLKIAGFALIGQVLLTISFFDGGDVLSHIEWDIYLFIATTNLALLYLPRGNWPLAILSLGILLVSPGSWKSLLPASGISDFFTGHNPGDPEGSWPLLPWFFFSLLFFELGTLIRRGKLKLNHWHRSETFVWPILLGCSVPFLGAYYHTPIGPHYYEWNFHKEAHIFWANFLPFVLIMRLSLLTRVQERLEKSRLSRWVASLMWNRYLGVSYIVSVLYIGYAAKFEEHFLAHPFHFDLFFASIMPLTEIVVRVLVRGKDLLARRKNR